MEYLKLLGDYLEAGYFKKIEIITPTEVLRDSNKTIVCHCEWRLSATWQSLFNRDCFVVTLLAMTEKRVIQSVLLKPLKSVAKLSGVRR